MWVIRESLRLVERIGLAVLIAVVIAELRTLAVGGDRLHAFQISLIVIGALLLMMGAMGPGSTYDRRLDVVGRYWASRSGVSDSGAQVGPVLTAGAVFVLSGAATIALGLFV